MSEEPTVLGLVLERLRTLDSRVTELHSGIGEVKAELVAVGSTAQRTLDQATKTNGRMDRAEADIETLQFAVQSANDVARGRREQREDDIRTVKSVQSWARDLWPVGLALIIGGAAVWGFLEGLI